MQSATSKVITQCTIRAIPSRLSSKPIPCCYPSKKRIYARFSSTATATAGADEPINSNNSASAKEQVPYVWKYPKAKDLFERITATMTKEDARKIGVETNKILGRSSKRSTFDGHGLRRRSKNSARSSVDDALDGAEAPVVEEKKTIFDLKLVGYDAANKIKIIKEIRAIAGLGLKEAKELVESAPKIIQKGMKPEDAEAMKAKLVEIGAQIEIV